MSAVEELLKGDIRLPSPPAIAMQILEIVQRDNFSLNDLSELIQSDPVLVARILRRVNSSFYSLPEKVGSIDTAVAVLGVNAVRNIALTFTIPEVFKKHRVQHFDFDHFWRRSAVAAVAADLICKAIEFKNDETFIAALLQDIGIAAMFICRNDEYQRVLEEKAITALVVTEVEKQVFGFDHQEMGARLLKEWGLPESIYRPIRYHHGTAIFPAEVKTVCSILKISDRLAAVYCGSSSVRSVRSAKEMLSSIFGLDEDHANTLVDAVAEQAIEFLSQLEIDPVNIKPFSRILEQAQQELSRLNMSQEMLVLEYKQAKEKSERLALELKGANYRLRELASRDGLTGMFNHRHFQEAIDKEIARALRYGRPCSLIMFDLDKFKSVNDNYGHRRGDFVLQAISEQLARTTRKSDIVARYGGEEFAVILPETNMAGAVTKAEACRLAIEEMAIDAEGALIGVTISGGVATFDPAHPIPRDDFIEAADKALYQSKGGGGNCISISAG